MADKTAGQDGVRAAARLYKRRVGFGGGKYYGVAAATPYRDRGWCILHSLEIPRPCILQPAFCEKKRSDKFFFIFRRFYGFFGKEKFGELPAKEHS
jgi:hypothetical protein